MKHTSWLSGLSAVRRSMRRGQGADLRLLQVADREHRARQLGLAEHVHDVALVLARSAPRSIVNRPSTVAAHARVVTGGDRVEAEQVGPLGEPGELHGRLHSMHGFGVVPSTCAATYGSTTCS